MTKRLFPVLLVTGSFAFAQVGFNPTLPNATLDVVGNPADQTKFDGIIAPRISGDQLKTKMYTAFQTGALVYVTTPDLSPGGQTSDVTSTGYFYFDGNPSVNKWVKISSGNTAKIRNLASGTIGTDDYTVLVTGNISLPVANTANLGKIYNLINDTASIVNIAGNFRMNGGNFSGYDLNNSNFGRGIIVQSTGSAWAVISRY